MLTFRRRSQPWFGFPIKPVDASTGVERGPSLLFSDSAHAVFYVFHLHDDFLFRGEVRRRSRTPAAEIKGRYAAGAHLDGDSVVLCVVDVCVVVEPVFPEFADRRNASMEIFVVGKQWMWHLQHPEGPREINELHVPVGVPVKLTMTSEDVIHDFFDSGVPDQEGRASRALHLHLVSGHEDRARTTFSARSTAAPNMPA